MTNMGFGNRDCERFLHHLDSHLSGDLPLESDLELMSHVNRCADCSRELEARKAMRKRLRAAVAAVVPPPFLEARIRNTIRAGEGRPSWARRLVPVAALVVVGLGGAIAYRTGYLRFTAGSQDSYIAGVSSSISSLMKVGLGDHIHCSVYRKFPKNGPEPAQLAARLGPEYNRLIPVVQQHVPARYRLVLAHQCSYLGRKFVHLSMKGDSRLLSLVITRKEPGESFRKEQLDAALVRGAVPLYTSGAQRFQLAGFESRDYLVYFVSDLSRQQNLTLMAALAPQVSEFLAHKEI